MSAHLSFRGVKAYKRPFQLTPHLRLLSVHWSEDGFSQAACIDGLDRQKAGKRNGKERVSTKDKEQLLL